MVIRSRGFPGIVKLAVGCLLIFSIVGLFIKGCGETQRVALGRALAVSPSTLCLDEPLSALDDQSRQEMYGILKTIHERAGVTTLHITHSLNEAHRLADRLYILEYGKLIEQANGETEQSLSDAPVS